ncbi:MAG: sulfotransferase, partial [Myxococcota bacterium]
MSEPIFILGPPRSGTTALAEVLRLHPEVSVLTHEAHRFHHDIGRFDHRVRATDALWLTAADVSASLAREYSECLAGLRGLPVVKVSTASIQVDFVRAIFPDARFVQILRDPLDVIASMEDLRATLQEEQGTERALGPAPDPFGLSVS